MKLSKNFLNRYQIELEASMRGSDFIFDCVNLLHDKCHKINLKRGGSYIDSPDCMKIASFNVLQHSHQIMKK